MLESIKKDFKNFYSNIWVQCAIALVIVEAVIFSVIIYLYRVLRILNYAGFDFYLAVLPTLGIVVVITAFAFLKEHRERRSSKK
jgi:hypothetical protein